MWLAESTGRGIVHVIPMGDWIEHEDSRDCVCMPRREIVLGDSDDQHSTVRGIVYTHSSLDGRELDEAT